MQCMLGKARLRCVCRQNHTNTHTYTHTERVRVCALLEPSTPRRQGTANSLLPVQQDQHQQTVLCLPRSSVVGVPCTQVTSWQPSDQKNTGVSTSLTNRQDSQTAACQVHRKRAFQATDSSFRLKLQVDSAPHRAQPDDVSTQLFLNSPAPALRVAGV